MSEAAGTAGADAVVKAPAIAQPVTQPIASVTGGVDVHPVVSSVIQSVYSDPTIQPSNAARVAANILNGLATYAPAILQISRASPRQQAWTGIGLGLLAELIAAFFPHPSLTSQG